MDVLRTKIYQWYAIYQRELPWRKIKDPYKIWLSEIILQQTRVAQGMEYYRKFTDKYKTINDLASSSEDNILKLWQGLGYYTRARNLHSTAKNIVKKYNGKFPETYEEIIQLKGIGQYTASAISSIAFGLPYPAIDGNIYRVLSRYFGLSTPIDTAKGKKEIEKIAIELISFDDPGFHNQAFMDFGALQCVPKSPDCSKCPVSITCFANQKHMVEKFPVKTKKVKQRIRYFYYYLIESNEEILMEKRQEKDIWQNLYQIPLLESKYELQEDEFLAKRSIFNSNHPFILKNVLGVKKHILSHQIIYAKLIHLQTNTLEEISGHYIRVNKKDIYKFAVPKLLENFFNEIKIDE
jgi:A/G-specific adenine glycosylase